MGRSSSFCSALSKVSRYFLPFRSCYDPPILILVFSIIPSEGELPPPLPWGIKVRSVALPHSAAATLLRATSFPLVGKMTCLLFFFFFFFFFFSPTSAAATFNPSPGVFFPLHSDPEYAPRRQVCPSTNLHTFPNISPSELPVPPSYPLIPYAPLRTFFETSRPNLFLLCVC